MSKKYSLICVRYGGRKEEHEVVIPDGVDFMCDPNEVGDSKYDYCNHYFTIVVTDDYSDWLENLLYCVDTYTLGKYTVVVYPNIMKETPIDVISWEDFFSIHKEIDLHSMVFVKYGLDYMPELCCRIVDFRTPWSMVVNEVVKDYSITINSNFMCRYLCDSIFSDRVLKVYTGDEGESWWSNMCDSVMCRVSYDTTRVSKDFVWDGLLKQYEKFCSMIGDATKKGE